jgi:hypothetical protein
MEQQPERQQDHASHRYADTCCAQDIEWIMDPQVHAGPVGFQYSATGFDLAFYAARSYSRMGPPSTSRRLIRCWERSAAG